MPDEFGNKKQALEQVARDRPRDFLRALVDTAEDVLTAAKQQALLQGLMTRLGLDTLPESVPDAEGKRFRAAMTILGEASGDAEGFDTAENAQAIAARVFPQPE